jgi:hypothetical protein
MAYHPSVPRTLLILVAIVATLAVVPRRAIAGKARPVHIESDPPGADVYVGSKEQGSRGKTPLDLELAPGEYVVIVELDGHVPAFQTLIVDDLHGKKAGPVNFKVVLAPGVSVLEVKGTAPASARVLVDGKDRGPLPVKVDLEPGAHQVQVTMAGREPYEQWIELEGGQEHQVTVSLEDLPAVPPPPPSAPRGPRPPLATVRLGPKAIWRRFSYQGAADLQRMPSFASDAEVMVRLEAEIAPWRSSRPAWRLWPLTLVLGAGITPEDTQTRATESANFNQRELEAGLRYRLALGRKAALAIDVGWAALLYNFNGALSYAMPDVDYHVMRLGVRGEGHAGALLGWVGIENRLVAGGGDLDGRFKVASADGFAARAGVSTRVWGDRLELGAEYALVRFSWEFEPKDTNPMYVADGATDTFHNLGVWVGGSY